MLPQNSCLPPNFRVSKARGGFAYRGIAAHISWLLGMLVLTPWLCACNPDATKPYPAEAGWDTSFTVAGVAFPDDTIQRRAMVATGSNYRLHHFIERLRAGQETRIGFIGGSITRGAKAASDSKRFSTRLCRFVGLAFPRAKIVELNAGIAATNSRFGTSRLQDDLLVKRPDMVVIEYAVNDDFDDTVTSAAAIEGIIRQCLKDPNVLVVLFQTMNKNGDNINQPIQNRIARHYSLPVIGYRDALWPLIQDGTISWSDLSFDDVHPNDSGHLICGYLLYRYLMQESDELEKGFDERVDIPLSLSGDLYENAGIFKSSGSPLSVAANQGWLDALDGASRHNFVSNSQGDTLAIKTSVREMSAIFHFSKELNSEIQVILEGVPVDTLVSHFPEDWGGGFLKTVRLFQFPEKKSRSVEFVNLTGGKFDLRYLIFAE